MYSVPTDISDMQIRTSILKVLAWSLDYFIQRTHVPGEEVTHILTHSLP